MQRTAAWHAQRRDKLTASNLGAALGQVGYTSRLTAYRRATGDDDFEGNAATRWGTDNEDTAIAAYAAHTGVVVEATGLHQHPTLEWLAGSPDGLLGSSGLLEVKCPYYQQFKGPHQSVPPHYYLQVQQLLQCTQREWCDYVCYCGAKGMSIHRIERDDTLFEDLMGDMRRFAEAVRLKTGKPPRLNKRKVTARVAQSMQQYCVCVESCVPVCLIVD